MSKLIRHKIRGEWEYPLFDEFKLCPTARYVGGTSKYVCECAEPKQCLGVRAVRSIYGDNS